MPIVTTVADVRVVPPFSVAFTVTDVAASSSPRVLGLAERVMPVGAASSSDIVVLTEDVPKLGVGPPPPEGLEMVTVNVSPVPSSMVSAVVWTVKVCAPAAALVKVSVPDLAV